MVVVAGQLVLFTNVISAAAVCIPFAVRRLEKKAMDRQSGAQVAVHKLRRSFIKLLLVAISVVIN